MKPQKPAGLHPLAWAKLVAEAETGSNLDAVMNATFEWGAAGCPLLEDVPTLGPDDAVFALIDAWVALNPQYHDRVTPNVLSRFILRESPGTYASREQLIARYYQHKQNQEPA